METNERKKRSTEGNEENEEERNAVFMKIPITFQNEHRVAGDDASPERGLSSPQQCPTARGREIPNQPPERSTSGEQSRSPNKVGRCCGLESARSEPLAAAA